MSKEPKEYAWDDPELYVVIKLGVPVQCLFKGEKQWHDDRLANPKNWKNIIHKYRIRPKDES